MHKASKGGIQKYIQIVILTIMVFYYLFPQALAVRGSSFILYAGVCGLGLYVMHKNPFQEVKQFIIVFLIFIGMTYFSSFLSGVNDGFGMGYLRSQMAWFFGSYFIMYCIFKVHKEPTADVIVIYILAALALQAGITALMYFSPEVKTFLFSHQLQTAIDKKVKVEIESQRLLGYGTALFGAGVALGYCLVLIMYFIIKSKLTSIQLTLLGALYVFVFYIGLFSARTTIVGLAMSFSMFLLLRFEQNKDRKSQVFKFMGILLGFIIFGYSLCYIYFPSFTAWAFEMYNNYVMYGSIETRSSAGLAPMLYAPKDFDTLLFGLGDMDKTGSDVGYTRLLHYVGIPGTIAYFMISIYAVKLAKTRDWNMNFLLLMSLAYIFVMNFKGITDINMILYLYFFYFMFYRYNVYAPKVQLRQMQMARKRREQLRLQKLQNKPQV